MSFGAKGFLTPEAFHEPDEIPNVLLQLLARCWEFDSSERPNARECMDVLSSMLGPDLDGEQTGGKGIFIYVSETRP